MDEQQLRKKATVKEAAEFLDVHDSWIYDRTRRNAIPHLKVGKYCRFDLEKIEKWAEAGCPAEWQGEAGVGRVSNK